MRKENLALLALFLLTVMAGSLVPVNAFIYPNGSVDGLYENFGPRLDRIQIIMYNNADSMWTGLRNGEIDITDWPLTSAWLDIFTTPPYNETVQVTSYGGEAGFYVIDFNLNNNEYLGNPPGHPLDPLYNPYPNPVVNLTANVQNPASDLHFRRGVSYIFNRTGYQSTIAGWGTMIYTPVPSYLGSPTPGEGLVNQDIRPGGALEVLTYPNNETEAEEEFALAKMKIVAGQNGDKRFWDRNDNNIMDAGEDIVLNLNSRVDIGRFNASAWIDFRLTVLGFKMDTDFLTGAQDYQETMLDKNYHIATLGWINLGPDPDFLYDLYYVNNYWHSPTSACPNTQNLNDTITNYWAEAIKFNETAEGARLSAWKFQERFAELAAQIPLFSNDGYKAHSRTYVGGTPEEAAYVGSKWEGLCNQAGFGDNSWYSFENAYPQGFDFSAGNMTIRYGWSETGYPQHLSPLYSESYWDREVLSRIYDTLGHRDPYDPSTWRPYLVQNWTVGTWMDGAVEKSKVTITLRPDVYFADGILLTVDDVMYSLTKVSHDLVDQGYPPPWSWPTTMQVQSANALDPYNIEILFGVKSYLAESWALGGFYIIPKHVWYPLIGELGHPGTDDPTQFAADPNVIGSGPWRYVSMNPGASLLMVANKPGSAVQTDRLGSSFITSPGVFNYYPVDIQAYEQSYLTRFLPGSNLEFHITLTNMWNGPPQNVSKYVSISNSVGNLNATLTSIGSSTFGIILAAGVPHEETFSVDNTFYGKIRINVTIEYLATPFVGLSRTVIVDPWVTLREDIGGQFMGTPGFPIPDFRVDQWDILMTWVAAGTRPGDLKWNPWADVNGDYMITLKDIALVAKISGWNVKLIGDINRDNKVDGRDIAIVAKAFGTLYGQSGYLIDADVSPDAKIDGRDIAVVAQQFGTVDP